MQKDKARDIGRGVLPSTARKGARDNKRAFHAKRRHGQRAANHAIVRHCNEIDEDGFLYTDPDLFEDFEDPIIFDGYHASTKGKASSYDDDMGYIVRRRRDADNLGPLFSWARATDAQKMVGWTVEDKRNYFKAILPDNLPGRHALGHVEQILDLDPNPFEYGLIGYREKPKKATKDDLRARLAVCLRSSKSRIALHEFILDRVPAAAHAAESNLKRMVQEQAVDENGKPRYGTVSLDRGGVAAAASIYPIMVDVPVPVHVAVTCDDCSFLRNDPLATTAAINRFVDILWPARRHYSRYGNRYRNDVLDHSFVSDVYDYVMADGVQF